MTAPTLPEFLLARYAEEEAVAIATRDAHDPLIWSASDYGDTAWGMDGPVDGPSGYESIVVAPARVLAECEAKRQIVEMADFADEPGAWPVYVKVLELLASVYADHPDYREEWRP